MTFRGTRPHPCKRVIDDLDRDAGQQEKDFLPGVGGNLVIDGMMGRLLNAQGLKDGNRSVPTGGLACR